MKTVFTNDMVAHVWAQQNQKKGLSSNHNLFFEGKTLYSYGRHFPLATFLKPDLVLINNSSYSVSTSKHQALVRQAVNHIKSISVDSETIHQVLAGTIHQINIVSKALELSDTHLLRASKRRKAYLRTIDIRSARHTLTNARELLKALDLKASRKITNKLNKLAFHSLEIDTFLNKLRKDDELKQKRANKLAQQWLRGEAARPSYKVQN